MNCGSLRDVALRDVSSRDEPSGAPALYFSSFLFCFDFLIFSCYFFFFFYFIAAIA
jgi:hypothetical protein